jgi:peptidoglycan/LPS O-acetylase OafA/YrhL
MVAGPAALAVLFGSLLVLAISARPGSLARRLFASSVLVVLDRYSYALYFFHNPIQAVLRDLGMSPQALGRLGLGRLAGQAAFCVLASSAALALAWVSWRVFEEPILRLKRFFPSGQTRPAEAVVGVGGGRAEES